jgi:hypothetical protein
MAEHAARELPNFQLEDALQLVRLYAERGSPKYEKAAMRWLERYLMEEPRLQHIAESRLISPSASRSDTSSRICGSRSGSSRRAG